MKKIILILTSAIVVFCLCTAPVNASEVPVGYEGKTISILGDSISTFKDYIPKGDGINLNHMATYPNDRLRINVEDTWWMQVIDQLGAKLGINDSWAGTRVSNFTSRNEDTVGKDVCMASVTRIKNLGSNGTPDVILFYGGTNDVGKGSELGSFDPTTAPTEVDLDAIMWEDFAQAYTAAIMRLQHFYPNAEIYALLPNTTEYHNSLSFDPYIQVMEAVCDHYGVETVDLRNCGIQLIHLPDGTHPDAIGMDFITEQVLKTMAHTHAYSTVDDQIHACECGKQSEHTFQLTTGIFGSETKECTVCGLVQEDMMPLYIVVGVAAAVAIGVIIIIVVVIIKKKKK